MAGPSVSVAPALSAWAPPGRRRGAPPVHLATRPRRATPAVRCSAGQGGIEVPEKLAELWGAARRAPPLAVIAGAAAAFAIYKVGLSVLAPPPPPPRRREEQAPPPRPVPEPVEVGKITEEELRHYDGSDPDKPLLMAIKGQIYDVSQSRMFYEPGGPYALFTGKDASRALAKMSFEAQDLTGDISGLTPIELGSLNDWEYKFTSKYVKVGTVITVPAEGEYVSISPEIRDEAAEPEPELNEGDAP